MPNRAMPTQHTITGAGRTPATTGGCHRRPRPLVGLALTTSACVPMLVAVFAGTATLAGDHPIGAAPLAPSLGGPVIVAQQPAVGAEPARNRHDSAPLLLTPEPVVATERPTPTFGGLRVYNVPRRNLRRRPGPNRPSPSQTPSAVPTSVVPVAPSSPHTPSEPDRGTPTNTPDPIVVPTGSASPGESTQSHGWASRGSEPADDPIGSN